MVDRLVSEPVCPAGDPAEFCRQLAHVLQYEIAALMRLDAQGRLDARRGRYDRLG